MTGFRTKLSHAPFLGAFGRFARRQFLTVGSVSLMRRYVRTHALPKLHLGVGDGSGLDGWLNTDLFPKRWPTVRLDVTQRFPLGDGTFHCVFSEHMIEHVPLAFASHMLRECHRVLRPGGLIRIATPDLAQVLSLYGANDEIRTRYLQWALKHNHLDATLPPDAVVINSLFHDHGHQFLFDEASLAALLRKCGFHHPTRRSPGQSDHPELRNLERHQIVIGEDSNCFETLVIDAQKP